MVSGALFVRIGGAVGAATRSMRSSRYLACALATGAAWCVAAPAHAAYPGDNGKIAFTASGDIWISNPDGTGVTNLTSSFAPTPGAPAFSPDGSRIAFGVNFPGPDYGLWVMNADGSDLHKLTDNATVSSVERPSWSPNGDRIAATIPKPGTPITGVKVVIVDSESGAVVSELVPPVPSEPGILTSYVNPAWKPTDSNTLAAVYVEFEDSSNYQMDIVSLSVNGGGATSLTFDPATPESYLDWAPDGSKLVFSQYANGLPQTPQEGIYTIPAAGGSKTSLTTSTDRFPFYSPDGSEIGFIRANVLTRMTANGSNPTPFLQPADVGGSWQPIDKGLVVNTTQTDDADLSTADGVCDSNSSKSGSQCTLRAAIQEANSRGGADEIDFKLKKNASKVIEPKTPLPHLTGQTEIDGLSQPGATAAKPVIELSGKGVPGSTGIDLRGADSSVKGLIVHGFKEGVGVSLAGAGGHNLQSSWLGAEPAKKGFDARPNRVGVEVSSPGNTVQTSIFSANGDVAGFDAYASGLDRAGSTPGPAHAAALRALGGGLHLEGGAHGTDIVGNTFGLDPAGARIGSQKPGLGVEFGNVAGILISPTTGSVVNTTIGNVSAADANVFSGNVGAIWALGAGGSVATVDVNRNFIGPRSETKAAEGIGNVVGVLVSGGVSAFDLGKPGQLSNQIQGNVLGVVMGGSGVVNSTIQANEIGAGKNVGAIVESLSEKRPTLGRQNLFGVILGDTQGVSLGGPGGAGNEILGNLIGVQVGGESSQANVIEANKIGLSAPPKGKIEDLKVKKLGGIIGILGEGGADNRIAGNTVIGTAIGDLSVDTTDWTVSGNTFEKNAIGQLEGNPAGQTVSGNTYTAGGVGLVMAADELAKGERDASNTEDNPVGAKDRKAPYQADNADLALDTVAPAVGTADLTASVTAVDPPDAGSGNMIQDNTIGASGGSAGNWVGALFAGDIQNTTFGTGDAPSIGENTVVGNRVAGVWIGQDSGTQSQIDLRGNSISNNHTFTGPSRGLKGLGIDLIEGVPDPDDFASSFGPSVNDPGDADTGPNGLQNYPEITSATDLGSTTQIAGTLSSKPSTAYSIEISASVTCGTFSFGEGGSAINRYNVTTDGSGMASIDMVVPEAPAARRITATATGPEGTSEFSRCVVVP